MVSFSKRAYQRQRASMYFDFLGFTFYWGRSRSGHVIPKVKTQGKRVRRKLCRVAEWARRIRNRERCRFPRCLSR